MIIPVAQSRDRDSGWSGSRLCSRINFHGDGTGIFNRNCLGRLWSLRLTVLFRIKAHDDLRRLLVTNLVALLVHDVFRFTTLPAFCIRLLTLGTNANVLLEALQLAVPHLVPVPARVNFFSRHVANHGDLLVLNVPQHIFVHVSTRHHVVASLLLHHGAARALLHPVAVIVTSAHIHGPTTAVHHTRMVSLLLAHLLLLHVLVRHLLRLHVVHLLRMLTILIMPTLLVTSRIAHLLRRAIHVILWRPLLTADVRPVIAINARVQIALNLGFSQRRL